MNRLREFHADGDIHYGRITEARWRFRAFEAVFRLSDFASRQVRASANGSTQARLFGFFTRRRSAARIRGRECFSRQRVVNDTGSFFDDIASRTAASFSWLSSAAFSQFRRHRRRRASLKSSPAHFQPGRIFASITTPTRGVFSGSIAVQRCLRAYFFRLRRSLP